jgi:hypothetical protein
MVIQEQTREACSECGHTKSFTEPVYGCDQCRKEIGMDVTPAGHRQHLAITIFRNGKDGEGSTNEDRQFCSWACVLAHIPQVDTDYFVTLPYLSYDNDVPAGQRAADFIAAVAAIGAR